MSCTKMADKIKGKQLDLHNQLLTEINDQLDTTTSEYAAFKMQITKPLGGPGVLGRCKDIFDIFRHLARRNQLGVLNYEVLKEAFKGSNHADIVNLIEDKETKIKDVADEKGTENSGPGVSNKRKTEEAAEITKVKASRSETEEVDPSDGKFTSYGGLPYYENAGKTGFLLIMNFTFKDATASENRHGLRRDISTLTGFFEDILKFDVIVLPEHIGNQSDVATMADLTSGQVEAALVAVQNYLNKEANAKKYYCFMCVILSHGDGGVFQTKNGTYEINRLREIFSNTAMPLFAAKPKIFILQTCQGEGYQEPILFDDEADDENKDSNKSKMAAIDESDMILTIPKDADVLFVFATTPGYKVNADSTGTFLINHMIEVFQRFYTQHHLEDMMISVRDETSQEVLPVGNAHCSWAAMMPYTWSTLTKRLRFTVGSSTWGSVSRARARRSFFYGNHSVLIDSVLFD